MEKVKNFIAILGAGITIGAVIVALLAFVVKATPKSATVGGVEFEIPTPDVSQYREPSKLLPYVTNTRAIPATESSPTQTETVPTRNSNIQTTGSLSSCPAFQTGETRTVSPGTFVLGDVTIDGIVQYTNNVGEGTIAYFEKGSTVFAPWGAGCYLGDKSQLEQVVQGEFQHGCGSTCTSVRFVLVQSNGEQTVQNYYK